MWHYYILGTVPSVSYRFLYGILTVLIIIPVLWKIETELEGNKRPVTETVSGKVRIWSLPG